MMTTQSLPLTREVVLSVDKTGGREKKEMENLSFRQNEQPKKTKGTVLLQCLYFYYYSSGMVWTNLPISKLSKI